MKAPPRLARSAVFRRSALSLRDFGYQLSARLRPLPHFLVIGAQKSGTTSLFHALCGHPQIQRPTVKEIHYFDLNIHRGLQWYRSHFRILRPNWVTGEATPYYLYHPLAPERARAVLPHVKVLIVLRDPARRAISHYHHEVARGTEYLSLEDALAVERLRLEAAQPDMFAHQSYSYVSRGYYAEQINRWSAYFEDNQLMIIFFEELTRDPNAVMQGVWRFLDLPPINVSSFPALNQRRASLATNEQISALQTTYSIANQQLAALLQRQLPPEWRA